MIPTPSVPCIKKSSQLINDHQSPFDKKHLHENIQQHSRTNMWNIDNVKFFLFIQKSNFNCYLLSYLQNNLPWLFCVFDPSRRSPRFPTVAFPTVNLHSSSLALLRGLGTELRSFALHFARLEESLETVCAVTLLLGPWTTFRFVWTKKIRNNQ